MEAASEANVLITFTKHLEVKSSSKMFAGLIAFTACVLVASALEGPDRCKSDNQIINDYKRSNNIGVSPVQLSGEYKFLLIFDNTFPAIDRNPYLCLKTAYEKDPNHPSDETKLMAISYITVNQPNGATGSVNIAQIGSIVEMVNKDPTNPAYFVMSGTSRVGENEMHYNGDFNFFHNEGGIIGYSACSVDQSDAKGIVLIVSRQGDMSRENIESNDSYMRAKQKMQDLSRLLTGQQELGSYEYKTSNLCG